MCVVVSHVGDVSRFQCCLLRPFFVWFCFSVRDVFGEVRSKGGSKEENRDDS